jgi:hypothetical protein
MMRRLVILSLYLLFLLPLSPAAGQDALLDLFVGDVLLILVNNDGLATQGRALLQAEQTAYFRLDGGAGVKLDVAVLDPTGAAHPFMAETDESGSLFVDFTATVSGPYLLLIRSAEGGAAGYVRLEYNLAPINPSPRQGLMTFVRDPLLEAFNDGFEDNVNNWWTGSTTNTLTEIGGSALRMTLQGMGQTYTGFTALPGTDKGSFIVSATTAFSNYVPKTSLGLIVRFIDGSNFYLFQIDPSLGAWRFLRFEENVWALTFGWHTDERLLNPTGEHRMEVWVLGDVYILMWDGAPLGHVRDGVHRLGGAGLFAESITDLSAPVAFDWLDMQVYSFSSNVKAPDAFLVEAVALTPSGATPFALSGDAPQSISLVGEWYWNNAEDTEAISLVLSEDGSYLEVIQSLKSGDKLGEERGTWQLADFNVLVLFPETGGERVYRAQIDSSGLLMTLPEYEGRQFVRLSQE